jgi:hypothetical protein
MDPAPRIDERGVYPKGFHQNIERFLNAGH